MPNPPKKFLSKTERQLGRGVEQDQLARNKVQRAETGDRFAPSLSSKDISQMFGNLGRGQTRPSSQVKKTKMSDRKLSKMGAGINTGLTAQRTKILKAIQRLPAAQQRKIYEALEGYAMD